MTAEENPVDGRNEKLEQLTAKYASPLDRLTLQKTILDKMMHYTYMADERLHGVILDDNTKVAVHPEKVVTEAIDIAMKETERFVLDKMLAQINRIFQNVYVCPVDKILVYPNYHDLVDPPSWMWCHCVFGNHHMNLTEYIDLVKQKAWQDTTIEAWNALQKIIAETPADTIANSVYRKNLSGRKVAQAFMHELVGKKMDMNKIMGLTKGQYQNYVTKSNMV